jgi:moderate conductance mechanosensitive channel
MIIQLARDETWFDQLNNSLIGVPIRIAFILMLALIAQFVLLWLIRRLVRKTTERAKRERLEQSRKVMRTAELSQLIMSQRTAQRANAIGSLLTSVTSVTIWAIAVLTILPLLGIAITPLLASAGVIGVALGFGAQTLVKDYLSGIFMIIEDQFGVGDVIDVGNVVGTVEEVALRYTRLRDLSGVVWYVRNGEILRVGNRSQGWTLAVVDIPVGYNENIEKVRDLVDKVGVDMDEDPTYDDMLLSAPAFVGVESVSGEAVVIRIVAKAVPEKQGILARAIRERIKTAFDRAGITIPVVTRGINPTQNPPSGQF